MLNFLLALWLINNYFYDQPFKNYVDLTLGQIGPYLILTLGVGGGSIKIFFLACITLAGIFGAVTANPKILWVQAVPGAIALALVLFS